MYEQSLTFSIYASGAKVRCKPKASSLQQKKPNYMHAMPCHGYDGKQPFYRTDL